MARNSLLKMGDVAQVKVVFTTSEEDLVLPESRQQLLVPAGMLAIISVRIAPPQIP